MLSVVFLALFGAVIGQQNTPIPYHPNYYQLDQANNDSILEVYYNYFCSDSAAGFPGLMSFYANNKDKVTLRINILTMTYIPFSFQAAQVGLMIRNKYPDSWLPYLQYCLENRANFTGISDTYNGIATKLMDATPLATNGTVTSDEAKEALEDDELNWLTRVQFKHATSNAKTGTPQYVLNGVEIDASMTLVTEADWNIFFAAFWSGQYS